MTIVAASRAALDDLVGKPLGPTEWLLLDQERVNQFADATDDHQWIHVDVERASGSPFRGTIAHGFLTLSLLPRFGAELFSIEFGGARLNYGLNKVRFPAPAPVGGRLRAVATVSDVTDVAAGTLVTVNYVIEVEGGVRPACVADQLGLVVSAGA